MTSRDFAYWLQGFFEVSNPETITKEQTDMIKRHLNLVFFHEIDPSYTDDPKKQEQMNHIHKPKPNYLDDKGQLFRC
jgi:hypothetical protein